MADEPIVTITLDRFRTKRQRELLEMLKDDNVLVNVNTRIKDAVNKFVPKKSGALRRSAKVEPDAIIWGNGLPYARYQYGGEVYGPNYPIIRSGRIVGWYSKRGMTKHPTGRELGIPGYWMGWRFGYTTKGTHHHWDQYFRYLPKLKTNLEITQYLKRECRRRGLNK